MKQSLADSRSRRHRADLEDHGVSEAVIVVDVVSATRVSVRPIQNDRLRELGETIRPRRATVFNIPYVFPSNSDFISYIPPKVGMEGFIIRTDFEIGEVDQGDVITSRPKGKTSGFFVPCGNITSSSDSMSASLEWAEIRSGNASVSIKDGCVIAQVGSHRLVLSPSGFDIFSNGVSLVDALKQISSHIGSLENLPNHPGRKNRMVDDFVKESKSR